jgi:hypothetical protein
MTAADACKLVLEIAQQLSITRNERDAYRELVSVSLAQLHDLEQALDRERATRHRAIAEYRDLVGRLREQADLLWFPQRFRANGTFHAAGDTLRRPETSLRGFTICGLQIGAVSACGN